MKSDATEADTVQMVGVVEVSPTCNPELDVALIAIVEFALCAGIGANVIV
jgi:hypothetical protein